MEALDSLKPGNQVSVTIFGPDGNSLYTATNSGFHNIESAISAALENANLSINPEDCVFEVANQTTGVSHRYRINAHGHLKLIV
ncbi:MAG: hypothetical protein J1F07_06490 [Muribaculaceae bacterium]|nr:hypothetical protein [Muribaculaceae bacterium]